MRFAIYLSLVFLAVSSVDAAHSSSTHSHARRSLEHRRAAPQKRQGLTGLVDDLGNTLGGITDAVPDILNPPGSNHGVSLSSSAPPSSSSSAEVPTSSVADQPSSSSIPEQPSSSSTVSSPGSTSSADITSSSSATPSSSSRGGGIPDTLSSIVGGGISIITSILPPTSFPASSSATPTSDASSSVPTDAPTASTGDSAPASSSTQSDGGIIPTIIPTLISSLTSAILPPTSTSSGDVGDVPTTAPTSAPASDPSDSSAPTPVPSSSSNGDIISSILSLTSVALPPPSTSDSVTPPPTPTPSSTSGGIISSVISDISSLASSVVEPITSNTIISIPSSLPVTSDPISIPTSIPITSPITSLPVTSDLGSSEPVTSQPVTSEPVTSQPVTSQPVTSEPVTSQPVTSEPVTSQPVTSEPVTSQPVTSEPVTSEPSVTPTSVPVSSSSIPIISFPSSAVNVSTTVAQSDLTSVVPTPTSVSVNSDLSFILTVSSLAFTSIPTSVVDSTLTDPDQPTTTIQTDTLVPATTLSVAPLPTDIPYRIYPKVQLDTSQDLSSFSFISVLFNQELNWPFVVQNDISSSQIFAWIPVIIYTALGIPSTDVKTFALQVYVPSSYHNQDDKIQLGTMWLGYIPSDQVDTLAAQIKARQSAFYTGVDEPVAQALASRVNSGFNLISVADPNQGGTNNAANGASTGASSASSKSRQDAIIGVVTALGAVALIVLAFLIYRSVKRRRELAHRRLSDPPADMVGVRPEGRQFDQDSVGGARRRSFYYAEDSLRGYQAEHQDDTRYDSRTSPNAGMTQRRNVVPAAISTPILRESSMNW